MIWLAMLPKWVKAAIGGALAASVLFGVAAVYVERERRQAAAEAVRALQDETRQQRLEHITRERERTNEIDTLDDDDLRERLSRWMRLVPTD